MPEAETTTDYAQPLAQLAEAEKNIPNGSGGAAGESGKQPNDGQTAAQQRFEDERHARQAADEQNKRDEAFRNEILANEKPAHDQQGAGSLIGTTVIYTLTDEDAVAIELRRAHSPAYRNTADTESGLHKAHEGPAAIAGGRHPLMITSENEGGTVNGQVFLDGNDTLFVQSVEIE